MADDSGPVGYPPGCRLVDLRVGRLALAFLGGRPGLGDGFAPRDPGSRRARRRRLVPAPGPRREAVAGRAGSPRRTGTDEGDLPEEKRAALSPGRPMGDEAVICIRAHASGPHRLPPP